MMMRQNYDGSYLLINVGANGLLSQTPNVLNDEVIATQQTMPRRDKAGIIKNNELEERILNKELKNRTSYL